MNVAWSEERVKRLETLVGEGLSAAQIGQAMGITRNAVIGLVHRRGIRLHHLPTGFERGGGGVKRKRVYNENDRARWQRCKATPEARAKARERMRLVRAEARAAGGIKSYTPRTPRAPTVRPEPPPAPNMLLVGILDLEFSSCRFPVGDPRLPGFAYCGVKHDDLGSYCAFHRHLAYQPPESQSRRNKAVNYTARRFG